MTQINQPYPLVQEFFKTNYLLQYYNNVELNYFFNGENFKEIIYYIGVVLTPSQLLNISQNIVNLDQPPLETPIGNLLRISERYNNGVITKRYQVLQFVKGSRTNEFYTENILTNDYIITDAFAVSGIDIIPQMYVNSFVPFMMPESAIIDTNPENLLFTERSSVLANSLEFIRLTTNYQNYGSDFYPNGPQPTGTFFYRQLGSELTTRSSLGLYNVIGNTYALKNLGLSLSVIEYVKCL